MVEAQAGPLDESSTYKDFVGAFLFYLNYITMKKCCIWAFTMFSLMAVAHIGTGCAPQVEIVSRIVEDGGTGP